MLPLLEGQAFLDWELLSLEKELAIKLGFCFVLIREKKSNELSKRNRTSGNIHKVKGGMSRMWRAPPAGPQSGLPEQDPPDSSGTGVTQTLTPLRGCREEADKEICIQPES